jgi:hypothetical protein
MTAAPEWQAARWFNTDAAPSVAALRGRVVLLHAFQMLCPGCVSHGLPQAERARARFEPEGLAVIGMHSVFEHHDAMRPQALAAFLHEYRISDPVLVDAHRDGDPVPQTMRAYGWRGTPSLTLIDRQGRVRFSHFGVVDDLVLGACIGRLLVEPAAADCTTEGCLIPALQGD